MPFVRATGGGQEAFERPVRDHHDVRGFRALDRVDDSVLYRIDRVDTPTNLLEGIAETDAVVLEARGGEQWTFHLRFTAHERLSAVHDHLIDRGIPIRVQRTYTLSDETELVRQFGLTEAQRKALALATGGTSTFREGRTSRDWPTNSAPPARHSPSGSVAAARRCSMRLPVRRSPTPGKPSLLDK